MRQQDKAFHKKTGLKRRSTTHSSTSLPPKLCRGIQSRGLLRANKIKKETKLKRVRAWTQQKKINLIDRRVPVLASRVNPPMLAVSSEINSE